VLNGSRVLGLEDERTKIPENAGNFLPMNKVKYPKDLNFQHNCFESSKCQMKKLCHISPK
jgi:hypothetical protein